MNVLIWNFLVFPLYHLLYVIQYLDVHPNIGLDEGIFNESGTLFLANCADDPQVFIMDHGKKSKTNFFVGNSFSL